MLLVKIPSLIIGFFAFIQCACAQEEISCSSPDKRFALQIQNSGAISVIELSSHHPVAQLADGDEGIRAASLSWRPDATVFAYRFTSGRITETQLWYLKGSKFCASDFLTPNLPMDSAEKQIFDGRVVFDSTEPVQWTENGNLVLRRQGKATWDQKTLKFDYEITIQNDKEGHAKVMSTKRRSLRLGTQ